MDLTPELVYEKLSRYAAFCQSAVAEGHHLKLGDWQNFLLTCMSAFLYQQRQDSAEKEQQKEESTLGS